ncbi:MAG: toll/interleukin-1 receptor domain-containing protein [Chloroflexi bacterium]|nr:toll/interleukin-1 receptor domain-containing protein [Chloroflexota bacterium]
MLTESQLRNYRLQFQESLYKTSAKSDARVSIFLSHSHKDKELVEGFINYLAFSSRIKIYVDWQDSDMPAVTNRDTALRIKKKIDEMDYFLVLATRNAMNSKWVPWEIGVADRAKTTNRIAIIPVADPEDKFDGNEYLQLYPRIEPGKIQFTGETTLAIFEVGADKGESVQAWLSR